MSHKFSIQVCSSHFSTLHMCASSKNKKKQKKSEWCMVVWLMDSKVLLHALFIRKSHALCNIIDFMIMKPAFPTRINATICTDWTFMAATRSVGRMVAEIALGLFACLGNSGHHKIIVVVMVSGGKTAIHDTLTKKWWYCNKMYWKFLFPRATTLYKLKVNWCHFVWKTIKRQLWSILLFLCGIICKCVCVCDSFSVN